MKISRRHTLGIDEAKARLENLAEELGRKLSLTYRWRDGDLHFRGTAVDGTIGVTESRVNIAVQLGFALMFVEASIRTAIESALDHHIGADK